MRGEVGKETPKIQLDLNTNTNLKYNGFLFPNELSKLAGQGIPPIIIIYVAHLT